MLIFNCLFSSTLNAFSNFWAIGSRVYVFSLNIQTYRHGQHGVKTIKNWTFVTFTHYAICLVFWFNLEASTIGNQKETQEIGKTKYVAINPYFPPPPQPIARVCPVFSHSPRLARDLFSGAKWNIAHQNGISKFTLKHSTRRYSICKSQVKNRIPVFNEQALNT